MVDIEPTMTVTKVKKHVAGQSGFCRHSKFHQFCHAQWETPSVIVTCGCDCHAKTPTNGPRVKVRQKPRVREARVKQKNPR